MSQMPPTAPATSLNSRKFQDLFVYRTKPRPSIDQAYNFERLGMMCETLTDLLYLNQLLETPRNPKSGGPLSITYGDPSEIKPAASPPAYVTSVFGDLRATGSYFRTDKSVDWAGVYPKEARGGIGFADAAEQANTEHLMLRKAGNLLGNSFDIKTLPAPAREAAGQYLQNIKKYEALVKVYDRYDCIPDDVLQPVKEDLQHSITRMKEEFARVRSFTLQIKDKEPPKVTLFKIQNRNTVNPKLPESQPLNVMFVMTTAGRKAIDRNRFPEAAFDALVRPIAGVESLTSETMVRMMNRLTKDHADSMFNALGFDKNRVMTATTKNAESLKLLYQFHKVVHRAYPSAFRDIEDRLAMIGETPDMHILPSPKAIAVMLYATAKRLEQGQETLDGAETYRYRGHGAEYHDFSLKQTMDGLLKLAESTAKQDNMKDACLSVAWESQLITAARHYARKLAERSPPSEMLDESNHPAAGLQLIEKTLKRYDVFKIAGKPAHER